MIDEDDDPCGDWCDSSEACAPWDGYHAKPNIIVSRGGPMADDDAEGGIADVTCSVTTIRYKDGDARVRIQPQTWIKMGGSWGIPGRLVDLLPAVSMTATRARYFAELLVSAADEADSVNDGSATEFTIANILGGDR